MIGARGVQVWLATAPVDMRRSFDGLAEHVRAFLGHDPLCGSMFVFRNKNAQRVKILWWDQRRAGHLLQAAGTRHVPVPRVGEQKSVAISSGELMRLLSGMDRANAARR